MNREVALSYEKKRKRRKRAAIISGICSVAIAVFIIIAFNIFYVDRFTISTSNEPGLCLSIDEEKQKTTSILYAPPLLKATDTQYTEIPEDIDEGLGSKNYENYYFAYSFYLGGVGDENSINYNLMVNLKEYSNDLEQAIRVMIIRDGVKKIYAASEDNQGKIVYTGVRGDYDTQEDTGLRTIPFINSKYIIVDVGNIVPGEFDKYTIVMWIDGWESVNSMKGGIFQAEIKFSTNSIN